MRHHTKDKGDAGLGFVIADLLSKGIQVALPISEHLSFDCIAISETNQLLRLSVKYRAVARGTIMVPLKSCWADRHGVHIKKHNKSSYAATAIYCPTTDCCYYIPNDAVSWGICLRMQPSKNHQCKGVKLAGDFADPMQLFGRSSPIG